MIVNCATLIRFIIADGNTCQRNGCSGIINRAAMRTCSIAVQRTAIDDHSSALIINCAAVTRCCRVSVQESIGNGQRTGRVVNCAALRCGISVQSSAAENQHCAGIVNCAAENRFSSTDRYIIQSHRIVGIGRNLNRRTFTVGNSGQIRSLNCQVLECRIRIAHSKD